MRILSIPGAWIRKRQNPLSRTAYAVIQGLRTATLPPLPGFHALLFALHGGAMAAMRWLGNAVYWTPMFNSRLQQPARRLRLYGGMPLVLGPLQITIGDDCRISGVTTLSGRWSSNPAPKLTVGRNCDIGHMTNISVGTTVTLGDNVRIAARGYLAGYPGHPLNAARRAAGEACDHEQARAITLEDDVWLGTGVFVMAGVTIGRGTIVAAGSVVTRDLPSNVVAGGNPANVIRPLGPEDISLFLSPDNEAAE